MRPLRERLVAPHKTVKTNGHDHGEDREDRKTQRGNEWH
jgi:hypothetical protein